MTIPSAIQRVAHRGMPPLVRENTLAGFAAALDAGADAIELDVHATADGVVVVHHDPTVRGLAIASTPWSVLRDAESDLATRVPRLDDVFDAVGDRAELYVEIKGAGIEALVLDVGRSRGRRWAVHSFDHDTIERAARLAPEVPRGVLLDRDTPDVASTMRAAVARTAARDVWPHWSLVDENIARAAQRLGVRLIPWTVNDPATIQRMVALGVAGICTDDVTLFG